MRIPSKILIVLVLLATGATAQTSGNDEILPKAKDWCIGIDASRLLNKSDFSFAGGTNAITGKYFINDDYAHRLTLRIGVNNWTTKSPTVDRAAASSSVVAFPSAVVTKENIWRRTSTLVGIGYGREKRRGKGRLQGVYGAEASLFVASIVDKFTYGNKLNPLTTGAAVLVDTAGDAMRSLVLGNAGNILVNPPIQGVIGNGRVTEMKSGLLISLGARAFIGAEYFVLPKLSVGGEFGWGFGYTLAGRSKLVVESVGQANIPNVTSKVEAKTTTIDGSRTSQFWLDNDNANMIGGASASLRVLLYF